MTYAPEALRTRAVGTGATVAVSVMMVVFP